MAMNAVITGWGYYVPPKVLTNADLEAMVNTSDAWIYERTGIRERHIVEGDEVTSGMAAKAAKQALAQAQVRAEDLDAIIIATTSPDYFLPTAACLVQESLGAHKAAVFDLGAACAGFVYGLAVARGLVRSGAARKILLVGAETISRFLDWTDRATCVLFGDGPGVIEHRRPLRYPEHCANGEGRQRSTTPEGAARSTRRRERAPRPCSTSRWRVQVFSSPCRTGRAAKRRRARGCASGSGLFVPPGERPHTRRSRRAGSRPFEVFVDIDRFGNTSEARTYRAMRATQGRVRQGDTLVFARWGGYDLGRSCRGVVPTVRDRASIAHP